MLRTAVVLATLLILRSASAITLVPEHYFLNVCSQPVELIIDSAEHHTVAPREFFCGGPFSAVQLRLASGRLFEYDEKSLAHRFSIPGGLHNGYWLISDNGLRYVSRRLYIRTLKRFEHTKT